MWKRLNSNQMCEKCSYKEVFLIKRFLIERFYCIYIYIYIYIYVYIYDCLCGSVAKASDTQAVGHGFEPHPDH